MHVVCDNSSGFCHSGVMFYAVVCRSMGSDSISALYSSYAFNDFVVILIVCLAVSEISKVITQQQTAVCCLTDNGCQSDNVSCCSQLRRVTLRYVDPESASKTIG